MRRLMNLKKKRKKTSSKLSIILISLILVFIIIFLVFKIINDKVTPILLSYAELEAKKFASIIINKAIEKNVANNLTEEELYIINRNENGEIISIDFNSITVNKVLTKVTSSVQMNLKNLEEGNLDLLEVSDDILMYYDKENLKKGIIFKIPTGVVFNNPLLTNLGPKIPVRFTVVGDVVSGVNTKVTNYGINNAMIELSVNIKLTIKVILPLSSENITIDTNVPIAIKMIQGTVPNYYSNGLNSNFSVPLQ
ncbi:MAG: sporulation protein YunB [Clostridium sp.]|nr:sporulation protein YunB [Clostridium sp.]MCM1444299.1 sporulation protein YunB [Candidatus Amulumruptor caecigallinarius]